MVKLAGISNKSRVLEPSAGEGKLADCIREVTENVHCFELNSRNVDVLKAKNYSVTHGDFLKMSPETFDAVVMCPPRNSIPHVSHAMNFLKNGSKLVALIREDSIGLDQYVDSYFPLNFNFVMNGESVPSGLLVLEK